MSAAACLEKVIASGAELYVEAGRLRGRGARPEPELFREHEAEIVALLASREAAAPLKPSSPNSAVDRAAEYHQRRIFAKEADLARQGLGPDGSTPLAEYQRLAAKGAKTAKVAGHESLPKATNTPPTDGPWPEPKITGHPPFGADEVPSRYEAGWQALLSGCPSWAAPLQWETAIFGCRDLFDVLALQPSVS